jgi:iron complex outermembrane recepter protein
MRNIYLLTLFILTSIQTFAQSQLAGTVKSALDQTPVIGASITIKGTVVGTVTNTEGRFTLKHNTKAPFIIRISSVGFATKEVNVSNATNLDIALEEENGMLQEVTVSGNRIEESIVKAPVTVEKLGAKQLAQSSASDVYFALQSLKGVDLLTQSLGFKSINLRGFGANNNNRFVQLTDGMDNRSPGLGFGFGNVAGISDIDIESIEILPGASSALYGPDALQGIMITKSKSPFEFQGLTAQLKMGVNNVGKSYIDPQFYSDFALRYAKQLGNRFAVKVNFQRLKGTDFIADNYSDRMHRGRPGFFAIDNANKTVGLGYVPNDNPATNFAYDGVNIYGDDFNNGGSFSFPANFSNAALAGKTVTRTGYTELELLKNGGEVFSNRANVSLYYKLTDKIQANIGWYYGNGNMIRTAGFREYFPDYNRHQFRAEILGDEFFVRAYSTTQTAEGYNLGNLAARMLSVSKTSATWGADFGKAFTGDIAAARAAADAGKPMAGSAEFNRIHSELINTYNNVPTTLKTSAGAAINGVRFADNSSMFHSEGMYNFKKFLPKNIEVITGASFRKYSMLTKGTIFPTKRDGNEFTINEYGWYVQASPTFKLGEKASIRPVVALRYDKNEYFKGGFTPRASAVLTIGAHNFRASWQSAFRNPSPNQLLADGKTGEVGGSQAALDGANVTNNPIYTEASVNKFRTSGNVADLVKYVPAPDNFTTEKITTWELGYKTLIANKLYVDAFYFNSTYNDFIATQNYIQAKTVGSTDDLKQAATSTTYQVNFNNTNEIYVNGWGIGAEYLLGKGYTVSANYANQVGTITPRNAAGVILKDAFGNDIVKRRMSDPDVAQVGRNFFISPENRYNITLSNPKVTKRIGFTVSYRWTDKMWVEQGTTQGDIWLPSWNTVDASVSIKMPSMKSIIKVGGSNIFNQYYSQGYGLAQIGGLYYVSINFDEMLR